MKKKLLLTAAGTATTWHICQIIKEYFNNDFEIHMTDINEDYLIPASIYANKFHKVPTIFESNYEDEIYKIIEKEKIDIIIPLIDFDLATFSKDNPVLKKLNCYTTAPLLNTVETLSNKEKMCLFLQKNNICTPKLYTIPEIKDEENYVIKPIKGFGSSNVLKQKGKEIKLLNNIDNFIIQECCDSEEEITAEIYNGEILEIFQRRRVATKAGVCTKMIPVFYEEIDNEIKKLINVIECPEAFCIQFMKNKEGKWAIIDCNLRIGAGTALSTKIGFQLVRALLTSLSEKKVTRELFNVDKSIKSVLRVYEEIIIK